MPPVRCSIIVPVYGRSALTRQCLDALLAGTERSSFEIVVVDDGSPDGSGALWADYDERVSLIANERNLGFARSCNAGAAVAEGEFLVFLNNDTLPRRGWLDALADYAEARPRAGAVGSKLLFPDGTVQHAGLVFADDRLPRHAYVGFPAEHAAVSRSRRFAAVTGACVLLRREAFAEAGGFDPHSTTGTRTSTCACASPSWDGRSISAPTASSPISSPRPVPASAYEELNRLFLERWGDRIEPDDLRLYRADGLLRFHYDGHGANRVTLAARARDGRRRRRGAAGSASWRCAATRRPGCCGRREGWRSRRSSARTGPDGGRRRSSGAGRVPPAAASGPRSCWRRGSGIR